MTNAQYKAALKACNFRDPDAVSKLVTSSHTNVRFNKKVIEKQIKKPEGASNYFTGFFGTEEWPDGQGQTYEREFYADVYIPVTFSHFVKTMQVCDPNLANECDTDYCEIPEGGRGTLPPISMYKTGFKTPRDCIANIRHIDNFWYWAKKTIAAREKVDETIINLFSTFAVLRTLGHKVILQAEKDANGNLVPIANNNPRNPFGMFAYNYMQELFPKPRDLENIVPLTTDILDILARHWTQFPENNHVAVGNRGQLIFEFWYPDDWYQTEAIHNPDYMEKLKVTMPANLFAGYSLNPNSREVIGNWAMRSMPWLPRFAESTEGGLIMVDTHEAIDIEIGQEWVGTRNFLNAPFGLAVSPSPNQGTLLKRPALTQSGAGFPIMPITGDGQWKIRNDYDKECNADLNKPYSQKRFEMGFMMNSPEGIGIIFRRRIFRLRPLNNCDLAPLFAVTPNTVQCPLTTVGCEDNKRRASDVIHEQGSFTWVTCSSGVCGQSDTAPFLYWLKTERNPGDKPDRNFLGCECGDPVVLQIHEVDEDGNSVPVRHIDGILKETRHRWPDDVYYVETQEELAEGECIKGIACSDGTNLQGNVVDCYDSEVPGFEDLVGVMFMTDSPISCEVGANMRVHYRDSQGNTLGIVTGTLAEVDHSRNSYRVTSATPNFACEMFDGQASVHISCYGGGTSNSTSSSSSSSSSSGEA
jgi:hypothetical protein